MTTTAVPTDARLSFGGVLRSEWIKLVSLRSTIWCYVIMAALVIGLGLLLAAVIPDTGPGLRPADAASVQGAWLQISTAGIAFAQLVAAVLGALVVTGEFGTGMIRSTFAAVPRRLPALAAKAIVFGATTFVVAFVAFAATALITLPLLGSLEPAVDAADGAVWLGLVGAAGYAALIGLFALGIGTIIRVSAGAIATALGILVVLPTVMQILGGLTGAEWAFNATVFLPSSAGTVLSTYPTEPVAAPPGIFQPIVLEPWQALLVVVAWAAVALVPGAVLLTRRDA